MSALEILSATSAACMSPPRKDSASNHETTRKFTILVADDARDLQDLITLWLEESGHAVTRASNGQEIARLVQAQAFDLLVTDIVMPDGDGWDAIAAVHQLRPETRILAISGGTREMPASACLRVARGAGAIGVLRKPFNRVDFLTAVAQVTR
ncbi:MAG: response regulator [Opitutaceae bacterium]|nr:response regulator [Opitutaceae bacterium]